MSAVSDKYISDMEEANANFKETIRIIQSDSELPKPHSPKAMVVKPSFDYETSIPYEDQWWDQVAVPEPVKTKKPVDEFKMSKTQVLNFSELGHTQPTDLPKSPEKDVKPHPNNIYQQKAKEGLRSFVTELRNAFKSQSKQKR